MLLRPQYKTGDVSRLLFSVRSALPYLTTCASLLHAPAMLHIRIMSQTLKSCTDARGGPVASVALVCPQEEEENTGQWSPAPLPTAMVVGQDVVSEEDDLRLLELLRQQVKWRGGLCMSSVVIWRLHRSRVLASGPVSTVVHQVSNTASKCSRDFAVRQLSRRPQCDRAMLLSCAAQALVVAAYD